MSFWKNIPRNPELVIAVVFERAAFYESYATRYRARFRVKHHFQGFNVSD
jgi:hypothetical protein